MECRAFSVELKNSADRLIKVALDIQLLAEGRIQHWLRGLSMVGRTCLFDGGMLIENLQGNTSRKDQSRAFLRLQRPLHFPGPKRSTFPYFDSIICHTIDSTCEQ